MKKLNLMLILIPFLTTSAFSQIAVGDTAISFSYDTLSGSGVGAAVSLDDYAGKVVYIFFYGAACPHCISNGPATETHINSTFKSDTNFVALGLDTWNYSPSANASFRNSTGITYTILLNARQTLVDYYGSAGYYDRSVVIGADGVLKYKGTSYVNNDYEQVIEVVQSELDALVVSSETRPEHPKSLSLSQNYPNPFNPSTMINYQLTASDHVEIRVFDLLGKEVAMLINGFQSAGTHSVTFEASELPSGIYLYQLHTSSGIQTRKMMLLK